MDSCRKGLWMKIERISIDNGASTIPNMGKKSQKIESPMEKDGVAKNS